MRQITIRLLGPFEVYINGELVTRFEYAKVRALLAYLALESHRPQPRASLAALLWPEQPERAARNSLSQVLTTLRNALGEREALQPVLLTSVDAVQLDPNRDVEVDVTQFLALLRLAETHTHRSWRTCTRCASLLQQAMALYRGNFLADFFIADSSVFEEWAGLQREHLLQRALSALGRLAEWAQWREAYVEAIGYARRLVALEPLIEVNQRVLIRLLALNGEAAAALAHYVQYRQYLVQEMDAGPEEATLALVEQIQRGETESLRPRQPPFAVPIPPTPMVGRARELREVRERLQDGNVRLLTILGTGGIGKTRLAIEAAHSLRYDFEDGVYFVDLSPLSDSSLVATTVAQALDAPERPEQSTLQALLAHLRTKHLLLVCDNFEHVLPAASLVSELLAGCPSLEVLASSREPLDLRAEQQLILEPLVEADTLQLFMQRARAAGANLAANDDNLAICSQICQRLDGLPLAIELIAPRARTLSPAELLRQLDRPLQAIAHGWRDVPERHRGLRNAIQWSYGLLNVDERRVFAHLGVFAGGCTSAAVQAVMGDEPPVSPILDALVEASLVQTLVTADESRFILLSTIREFASEKLAELGEHEGAQQRLASFFVRLVEAAEPALKGPEQASWIKYLEADRENIRAALRWCYENDPTMGLQIATSLWYFYELSGPIREGRDWLNSFVEKAESAPLALRANALSMSAALDYRTGQYAAAKSRAEASLSLYKVLDHPAGVAQAHNILGNIALDQEQYEIAARHYRNCLESRRRLGDRYGIASVLNNLAICSHLSNSLQEAESLFGESLSLYQEVGDLGKVASVSRNLAELALTRNDPLRAKSLFEESLALCLKIDNRRGIGLAHNGLGQAELRMNDLASAREHFVSALRLFVELMDPIEVLDCLVGLAATAQATGAFESAARLVGAIAAVCEDQQIVVSRETRRDLDQVVEATQARLGSVQYEKAWGAGRALTTEQAVSFAINN